MDSSDINYLIERQDVHNNWHLIETSENVVSKILDHDPQILGSVKKYSNHAPLSLLKPFPKLFTHFSLEKTLDNHKIHMQDIYFRDMEYHNFNPLTQCYLKAISDEWEYFYHIYRFQSFENIINSLKSTGDFDLKNYSELLIKSIEHFLKLETMTQVKSKISNIDQSLESLVSAHHCLKIMSAEFEEHNLSKFRMIVYYKY